MKKLTQMGLILSFALILSYIESLIPFSFGIPGIKLGLANYAVLLTLYLYNWREAITLSLVRIVLASFLFGNLSMMIYSLAGGIVSFSIMCLMKKTTLFSPIGVSMGGGVFHNIGQIIVAYVVTHTFGLVFYLPALMLAGLLTGGLIGMLQLPVLERLRKANVLNY